MHHKNMLLPTTYRLYPQRMHSTTYTQDVYPQRITPNTVCVYVVGYKYTLWIYVVGSNENVPTTYNTLWGTLPTTYRFTPTTYKIYTVGNIYVVGTSYTLWVK